MIKNLNRLEKAQKLPIFRKLVIMQINLALNPYPFDFQSQI